jgi:hypothetical protein
MLGAPVTFELSVTNVDKRPLEVETVLQRLQQFTGRGLPLALTRAALYSQKAERFPGCVFVVGYDTAARLFEPRYYGDSVQAMHRSLEQVMAAGCRFLVAGRFNPHNQRFKTVIDLDVPARFDGLLAGIPEDRFRIDISSTEIRERAG